MLDTFIQYFFVGTGLAAGLVVVAVGIWLFATLIAVVFIAVVTLIANLLSK